MISKILGSRLFLVIETAVTVVFLYIAIKSGNSFNSAFWGVVGGLNISSWIAFYYNYKRDQELKKELKIVIEMIAENEEDEK